MAKPAVPHGAGIKADRAAHERRRRTLEMLGGEPRLRYALVVDHDARPDAVIVAMAVRINENSKATCYELCFPRDKFYPHLLMQALEHDTRH